MKHPFKWLKSEPRKTFACGRCNFNYDINLRDFLTLSVWVLVFALVVHAAWNVHAQEIMPPTNVISAVIPNTNIVQVGQYQMTIRTNYGYVNPCGIVGYINSDGTNATIVQCDSTVYQIDNNRALITDPDHNEHLQILHFDNWMSSGDLSSWQANTNSFFVLYDLPYQPQQFFKLPIQ